MSFAGGQYAIHGTNKPDLIGHFVSCGCIRMSNAGTRDLYNRVSVRTRVVVQRTTRSTPRLAPPAIIAAREAALEQSGRNVGRVARRHGRIDPAAIFVGPDLRDRHPTGG